jgi:hypothetical protein
MLKKDPHLSGDEKAYKRRHLPLPGGRSVWEKARDVSRESKRPGTWRAYPVGRSLVSSRERSWRMRGSSLLPRTCKRHHYRDRSGNDGKNRLVMSHRRSMLDGLKDSTEHSPARLCHRPRPRDICVTCSLATVVSP